MDCSNCLVLKKQFEDLKQKHIVDFRTIKQKIISTDTLIRSYQEKCQESDKQKKYVVELTSKLDGAQRSVEVIKLQLKKSLELKEPLQQKCNELERERAHQCAELESLQDRVKGFENLVGQLQSVIKENEKSRNSVDLEASFHKDEIEELKKNQKKTEAQIKKLSERLQAEKNTNKALNKELKKSESQVKTLLEETEESKKCIMKLQKQLDAGRRQNDHCEQERNILLDKQMLLIEEYQKTIKKLKEEVRMKAKQENSDEDKNPSGYKIESPITRKMSPRKWNDVSPKREESSGILEQKRPLTRLQQKNLIIEIEKKSLQSQITSPENISPSQHKNEEELEMETLLDMVNEMLDAPYCPPLSPLPPSPFLDRKSVGEFGNNDSGDTCDENISDWNTVGINNDLENNTGDNNDVFDIDSKNHCDEINEFVSDIEHKKNRDSIETEDLEKSKGKKRELEEFCGTPMSLRSGKKRKNGNSENEVSRVYTLRRTKSADMTSKRNTTDVDVRVTRSKSVEETMEGVLEVKPKRRRRKLKLSSNDGDHEHSFESSDNSAVEANAPDTSMQSLDTSNAQKNLLDSSKQSLGSSTTPNDVLDLRKQASDIAILENNVLDSVKQSSDISTTQSNVLNSQMQTSDVAISEGNVVGLSKQSSDNTAKNDVLDLKKQCSDIAISENCVLDSRKESPDFAISENNVPDSIEQSSDDPNAKKNVHDSRNESSDITISENNILDSIEQLSDTPTSKNILHDSRNESSDIAISENNVVDSIKQSSETPTANNNVDDSGNESSGTAILESNVLDSTKQSLNVVITEENVAVLSKESSDISTAKNTVIGLQKQSSDFAILESNVVDSIKQSSDISTAQNNVLGSSKQPSDIAISETNALDFTKQLSDTSNVLDLRKQTTDIAIVENSTTSDSATLENNVVGLNMQFSDIAFETNNVVDSRKRSLGSATVKNNVVDSNKQSSDIFAAENNVLDSRKQLPDIAIAKNNALDTSKQSSDIATVVNIIVDTTKDSDGSCEEDNDKERKGNNIFQESPGRPRTRPMDKLDNEGVVNDKVCCEKETSATSQTNSSNQIADVVLQTVRPDELARPCLVREGQQTEREKCIKFKVSATENRNNIETTSSLMRGQTRPIDELCVQHEGTRSKLQGSSDLELPSTQNKSENKCNENIPVLEGNGAERNYRESNDILRDIIDTLASAGDNSASSISEKRTSATKGQIETNSCIDTQDIEVMKCLYDVTDSVVQSNHITPHEKCAKPLSTTMLDSKVAHDINKASLTSIGKTNNIEDNYFNTGNSSARAKDKSMQDYFDSSRCLEPFSATSASRTETQAMSVTVHENELSGSFVDQLVEHETAEIKADALHLNNSLHGTELVKPKTHSLRTQYITKNEITSLTTESYKSTKGSTISNGVITLTKLSQESSLSLKEQLEPISTSFSPISITPKKRELIKPKNNSQKTQYMTKNETSDSIIESDKSTEGSTISNGVVTPTKLHQDSSVCSEEQLEPIASLSPIPITPKKSELIKPKNHSQKTQCITKNETTFSKTESDKSTEGSTTSNGVITPTTVPQDSSVCLEEQLEPISSLSPIHVKPKKSGDSVRIPCFDSLDQPPLSPIPPSPPPATLSSPCPAIPWCPPQAGEAEQSVSANLTKTENMAESGKEIKVGKKQNIKRNQLPTNALLRYPGVNEIQFTVFIFTKLKNREITLEDLITAFSVRKNIRNHTPIANGLVSLLKSTQEGDEHVLMEVVAERYNHESEGTGRPMVSDFEMQVLIAVNRLSNLQRHANLLNRLVKLLGMSLCQLFTSEKNDTGILVICRIFAGVCRLIGEGSRVRVLCYDILKQNKRHPLTEKIILSIALVWPSVLGKGLICVTIHTGSVTISGYRSFLAILEIILMSREVSCEQSRQCLQRICGWYDVPSDKNVLEWLARDLVRVLRVASEATFQDSQEFDSVNNAVFETIKSLELLAIIMGWKWTNDILIREMLWPVFKDWMEKGFDSKQEIRFNSENKTSENMLNTNEMQSLFEAGTIYCDKPSSLESNVDNCQAISNETCSVRTGLNFKKTDSQTNNFRHVGNNHDHNTDAIIKNILHLFGLLGYERLQKGEMVDLDAVINLMSAIVSSPDCEKVSFRVQHSAADALLTLIRADPVKIVRVLEDWIKKCSKINDISTAEFERRMKNVRTNLWTT